MILYIIIDFKFLYVKKWFRDLKEKVFKGYLNIVDIRVGS